MFSTFKEKLAALMEEEIESGIVNSSHYNLEAYIFAPDTRVPVLQYELFTVSSGYR